MRKKLIWPLILQLMLIYILFGCSSGNGNGPGQDEYYESEIYTGIDSLNLEIMENMPASDVYEDSSLQFGFLMENKGSFNIENGFLALSLEQDYFDIGGWDLDDVYGNIITDDVATFNIKGKSKDNHEGESGFVSATIKTKIIPLQQPKEHLSTIVLTACYPYQTTLFETVCIDTDINGKKNIKKSCEVEDIVSSGQGAPIVISGIEVKMMPGNGRSSIIPEFIIHIENQGEGQALIYNIKSIENACTSSSISKEEFNKVTVWARLSDKNLKCTPSYNKEDPNEYLGFVDISKQEDVYARCILEEGIDYEKGSYTTPLVVQLNYGYTFSISKEITIKRVN